MGWYAIDRVEDAIDLTGDRLWPVDRGTWLRFALLVFFVGGGSGFVFNPIFQPFSGGGSSGNANPYSGLEAVPDWVFLVVIGFMIAGLAFGLAMGAIGSILEFVFVESLRSETIDIRSFARTYLRDGLRLFGFRLGLAAIVLAAIALPILSVGLIWYLGFAGLAAFVVLLFVIFSPVAIALFVVLGLIQGFTRHFVVPIMMLEDRGVLSAWKRLWPALKRHWKQVVVYILVMFVVNMGVGLLGGMAGMIAAIVLILPAIALGGPIAFGIIVSGGGTIAIAGVVVLGAIVVIYAVALIVVAMLINVPLESYRRYFTLLVLGDLDAEFDIVPGRRAAIEN